MAKRVVEVSNGGSGGFGVVGVIIGALLVLGVIFFFAGGRDMIASNGAGNGSAPSVTVNTRNVTPTLPSGPRSAAPATTGSSTTR